MLDIHRLQSVLEACSGKRVALDVETTGLKWWADRLITLGIVCPDAGIEEVFDFPGEGGEASVVKRLVSGLLAKGTTVIAHNAKFDLHFLGCDPDKLGWRVVDTTVLVHLYDSRLLKGLDAAERKFLGTASKRAHVLEAPPRKKIWDWPAEVRMDYCLNDCRVTYQLAERVFPLVRSLELTKLEQKDSRYLALLWRIERQGYKIDRPFVMNSIERLTQDLVRLEAELREKLPAEHKDLNWRSHQKLSIALYEGFGWARPVNPFLNDEGVDTSKFADRGKYNKTLTSTFILSEKAKHPLAPIIASLRETYKLRKTLQEWLVLCDENDVIHTNYNVTGTRTARLSSSKPNLQNIASAVRNVFTGGETLRTEEYNLRNAFIARPGKTLLSIDHKQQEMRMFGLLSQDPNMLGFLERGLDIHSAIAETVWGSSDQTRRKWSKQITLGLIYGMSSGSLQFKLGMDKRRAEQVVNDYWKAFPRIRPWLFETINECRRNGYLRYWSGRLWREENEGHMYKGANALIQGGCADLMSIAALRADEWLRSQGEDYGRIVNLIHDELTFEVPDDPAEIQRAAIELSKIMEVGDLFGLPFFTDCKTGRAYGSLKEYDPHAEIGSAQGV